MIDIETGGKRVIYIFDVQSLENDMTIEIINNTRGSIGTGNIGTGNISRNRERANGGGRFKSRMRCKYVTLSCIFGWTVQFSLLKTPGT